MIEEQIIHTIDGQGRDVTLVDGVKIDRKIYDSSIEHSSYLVRTMFVPCSYHVRTMFDLRSIRVREQGDTIFSEK